MPFGGLCVFRPEPVYFSCQVIWSYHLWPARSLRADPATLARGPGSVLGAESTGLGSGLGGACPCPSPGPGPPWSSGSCFVGKGPCLVPWAVRTMMWGPGGNACSQGSGSWSESLCTSGSVLCCRGQFRVWNGALPSSEAVSEVACQPLSGSFVLGRNIKLPPPQLHLCFCSDVAPLGLSLIGHTCPYSPLRVPVWAQVEELGGG